MSSKNCLIDVAKMTKEGGKGNRFKVGLFLFGLFGYLFLGAIAFSFVPSAIDSFWLVGSVFLVLGALTVACLVRLVFRKNRSFLFFAGFSVAPWIVASYAMLRLA